MIKEVLEFVEGGDSNDDVTCYRSICVVMQLNCVKVFSRIKVIFIYVSPRNPIIRLLYTSFEVYKKQKKAYSLLWCFLSSIYSILISYLKGDNYEKNNQNGFNIDNDIFFKYVCICRKYGL